MTKVGEHITLDIIGTKKEYDPVFFEKLVYKNDLSKQYCYRSPNRKCTINILKVYKIIFN